MTDRPTSMEANELRDISCASEPEGTVPVESHAHPSGTRLVFLIIALLLSLFLGALDGTILAQAIPSMTDSFGGVADVAWYSTAYGISNTAFKMAWGKAYKHFRLKRTFLLSMAVFEAGNVVCATAQSSSAVILGRIVAGSGGAGLMCGSFVISALSVKPQYRPMMMGVTSLAFALASVTGPIVGGALVDALSWRWCFWINLPLGALAAGTMIAFYNPPAQTFSNQGTLWHQMSNLDLHGGVLVGGSLVCYVLAMNWAGTFSWSSPRIVGSLVGSVLLAVAFAANERLMGERAMFQPRLLRNPKIAMNCVFALFFSGVLYPLEYILPIQFQSLAGQSAAASGVRMIPLLITVCVFTLFANGILTWKPMYSTLFVSGALAGTAGAAVMYTLDGRIAAGPWIGAEVFTSVGVGLALQLPIIANNAAVAVEDISVATSLALFFENVGTVLFVAASEAALTAGLVRSISSGASDVSPQLLLATGATSLRTTFSAAQLPAVLQAYLDGCKSSHLVPVACGSAAALTALIGITPAARKSTWRRFN